MLFLFHFYQSYTFKKKTHGKRYLNLWKRETLKDIHKQHPKILATLESTLVEVGVGFHKNGFIERLERIKTYILITKLLRLKPRKKYNTEGDVITFF